MQRSKKKGKGCWNREKEGKVRHRVPCDPCKRGWGTAQASQVGLTVVCNSDVSDSSMFESLLRRRELPASRPACVQWPLPEDDWSPGALSGAAIEPLPLLHAETLLALFACRDESEWLYERLSSCPSYDACVLWSSKVDRFRSQPQMSTFSRLH